MEHWGSIALYQALENVPDTKKNIGVEVPHINLQNRLDYEVFCQSENIDVLQMRGSTAYVKLSDIRSSSGVTKAVLLEFGEETTNSCKNYAD